MSEPFSPYWLASALGLNAAGNTGSNLSSLPPLVINSMDYFTNPDYLKPKDKKDTVDGQYLPGGQPLTKGIQEITQTRKITRVKPAKWKLDELESRFAKNKFVTSAEKQHLSEQLHLSCDFIKFWFQNRRAREKRESTPSSNANFRLVPKTGSSTQFSLHVPDSQRYTTPSSSSHLSPQSNTPSRQFEEHVGTHEEQS